jgi:hypothetical protein
MTILHLPPVKRKHSVPKYCEIVSTCVLTSTDLALFTIYSLCFFSIRFIFVKEEYFTKIRLFLAIIIYH